MHDDLLLMAWVALLELVDCMKEHWQNICCDFWMWVNIAGINHSSFFTIFDRT